MSYTESPYYYDFLNNEKSPKEGQQAMSSDVNSECNIDTVNSNHVHNDDWNNNVNDRQTNTFNIKLAASN